MRSVQVSVEADDLFQSPDSSGRPLPAAPVLPGPVWDQPGHGQDLLLQELQHQLLLPPRTSLVSVQCWYDGE